MSGIIYTIHEERTFKQPTIYRLTYRYTDFYSRIFPPSNKIRFVSNKNLACVIEGAFKTESKEEIEEFKQFCIQCDKDKIKMI